MHAELQLPNGSSLMLNDEVCCVWLVGLLFFSILCYFFFSHFFPQPCFISSTLPQFPAQGVRAPDAASPPSFLTLTYYCADVDEQARLFTAAGGVLTSPPADQFWGDRYARGTDPFGYTWAFCAHVKDVDMSQVDMRAEVTKCSPPPQ